MCFANLEDMSGSIELIVFPKTFEKFEEILNTDQPVMISGFINLAEEPRKMFPEKIELLKEHTEDRVSGVRVEVNMKDLSAGKLNRLKQVMLSYRGSVPIHLILESEQGRARLPLGDEFLVNPSPQMAARINEVLNANAVKLIIDGKLEEVSTSSI